MRALGKNSLKFLILVACLFLFWTLSLFLNIDISALRNMLGNFPFIVAGPVFIALYCIVTFFLWMSKDVFRIVAVFAFGAYWSTLFIWLAECINAFILFNGSRYLGKDFVQNTLPRRGLYNRISRANFFWLLIFRVTPLLPFRFMDIGCGLTGMSFRRYFAAMAIGSPLRIFWVQFILAGAGEAVFRDPSSMAGYFAANRSVFFFSLVFLVLIAIVAIKMRSKRWQ